LAARLLITVSPLERSHETVRAGTHTRSAGHTRLASAVAASLSDALGGSRDGAGAWAACRRREVHHVGRLLGHRRQRAIAYVGPRGTRTDEQGPRTRPHGR